MLQSSDVTIGKSGKAICQSFLIVTICNLLCILNFNVNSPAGYTAQM